MRAANGTGELHFRARFYVLKPDVLRMVTVLAKKLNESGWIDDIHHRSKGTRLNPGCVADSFCDTYDIIEAARAAEPKRTVQELVDELRPDLQCKSSCIMLYL